MYLILICLLMEAANSFAPIRSSKSTFPRKLRPRGTCKRKTQAVGKPGPPYLRDLMLLRCCRTVGAIPC